MKYIFIALVGFLAGFTLLGGVAKRLVLVVSGATSVVARPAAATGSPPQNSGVSLDSSQSSGAAGAPIVTTGLPGSSATSKPPGKPARERPQAFNFSLFARVPYEADRVSEEVAASAEYKDLLRKVEVANLRDWFSPTAMVVGLTGEQVERFVNVVADSLDQNPVPREPADKDAYTRRYEAITSWNASHLAEFLSDDQLEMLAGPFFLRSQILEPMAERGIPLTTDQIKAMEKWVAWPILGESYNRIEMSVDPATPGLSPEQRKYLTMVRDWNDQAAVAMALQDVEVRDPDLFDIWPW